MTIGELMAALDRGQMPDTAELVVDVDGELIRVAEVGIGVNLVRIVVEMEEG